ncbi:hypothetical protein PV08_08247 [Exophiala spinifera]|uniref:Transcription factor domain-containing protein n=1 Tax=Exophiala spinifera TaxID=91928 RepID=A0A0D2B385_9EURO|nr:uncharacterized protein PV08_08247 [Exophiala spinifera]KIW13060.1 hypothetical protein PV08_08247 [Exophiala spinifera]
MAELQLSFVQFDQANSTQREKELVTSFVRSHTARFNHAKRKTGVASTVVGDLPASSKPLITRFRLDPHGASHDSQQSKLKITSRRRQNETRDETEEAEAQTRRQIFALLYREWRGSIKSPFSGGVPKHIAIYQQMIVPTIQLAFEVFHVRDTHNHEFIQWMTRPTTSGYHAGAAGLQLLYDMQVSPGRGQTQQCLFHKVKAFEFLRETLSQSPSKVPDDELLAILSLATVERTVDMKAHQYHLEILSRIITAQGGIETVSDHPKCTILQFDSWWSLSTGLRFFSRPQLLLEREGASISAVPSRSSAYQLGEVPRGFHKFILDGTWLPSTVEIIIRLSYVYSRSKLERDASEHIIGLPYATQPVRRTFQEACPALDATGQSQEKLLALAIVVYCGLGFDSAPIASNGGLASRAELTKMLKQYTWECDTPEQEDFMFWIWAVTICAWRSASGNSLMSPGLELFWKLRQKYRQVKEWNDGEAILVKFFWNKKLSELFAAEFEKDQPLETQFSWLSIPITPASQSPPYDAIFNFVFAYLFSSSRFLEKVYGVDHETAHTNAMKHLFMFVKSALFATVAKVLNETVNSTCLVYSVARAVCAVIHLFEDTVKQS